MPSLKCLKAGGRPRYSDSLCRVLVTLQIAPVACEFAEMHARPSSVPTDPFRGEGLVSRRQLRCSKSPRQSDAGIEKRLRCVPSLYADASGRERLVAQPS
jgi:hypothetical protein